MPTVGTWNMQGRTAQGTDLFTVLSNMMTHDVDVLCLQECGQLQERVSWKINTNYHDLWEAMLNMGTYYRPHYVKIYYYPYGDNIRCSMAIMVDMDGLLEYEVFPVVIRGENNIRPCIGICCRKWGIFCVHAPSGMDSFARKTIYGFIKTINKNYNCGLFEKVVIAGDFNTTPDSFNLSDGYCPCYIIDNHGYILSTRPSSDVCYDYCILKNVESYDGGFISRVSGMSDHQAVYFKLE